MADLELRELNLEEVGRLYRRELKKTFPPSERKPLHTIQRHMREGNYRALGLFQGPELVGYALLWQRRGEPAGLLDYLGVPEERRGQGYGSELLARLLRSRGGDTLLAEVEAPEAAEREERSRRERRLSFYRRAGFQEAGFDCLVFGVHYRMLAAGPGDPAAWLEAYRALYREQLPRGVYETFVKIPWNRPD